MEYRGVAGTEYRYILRFQPKETGESLRGLPGIEVASESTPGPCVRRDIRAARPVRVCGSRSLRRPSMSSSPGSVAKLQITQPIQSANQLKGKRVNAHMLCSVGKTRKPSRNVSYSATSSSAWRVSSASTARAKTGSSATAARNTLRSRCLRASSSPTSEGRSQYGVRAQRQSGRTDADCQSTTAS
jgi:hypothetical protein